MIHIKEGDPEGVAIRRSAGAQQSFPEPKSAANDDNRGPWPFVPFPEGSYSSVLFEVVAASQRLSWKAKLIKVIYLVVTPIALVGWWYLIVSGVVWMLN